MESLYRKYRPQTFADVVGQQHVVGTLRHAVLEGRTSHAYLFCGPRGTGKTTMARLLAKALMCEQGQGHLPDGTCEQCRLIASGDHPDVYELDAASRTGVDSVREEIINNVNYAPTRGSYKIYIIDEVHMLTSAAFNALLKTLEEPPDHVVFVLCTTDPQKIPPTILSRVQRFDFRPIGDEDIRAHLAYVCEQEGFTYEDGALDLVTINARGGMRDALSTLEQLSVFGGGVVSLEAARDLLGAVSGSTLEQVINAMASRDVAALFVQVGELVNAGGDLLQFTRELAAHLRDVYVVAVAGANPAVLPAAADVQRLQAEATAFGSADRLARILTELGDVSRQMGTAPNQRLVLEIAFTRIARPKSDLTLESLAERIAELEIRLAGQGSAAAQPAAVTQSSMEVNAVKPAARVINSQPAQQAQPAQAVRPARQPAPSPSQQQARQPVQQPPRQSSRPAPQQPAQPQPAQQPMQPQPAQQQPVQRPAQQQPAQAAFGDPGALQRAWRKVVKDLVARIPARGTLLTNAQAVSDNGNELVVGLPKGSAFALKMLERPDIRAVVEASVAEVFGKRTLTFKEGTGTDLQLPKRQPRQAPAAQQTPQPVQTSQPVQMPQQAMAPQSAPTGGSTQGQRSATTQQAPQPEAAPTSPTTQANGSGYPMPWDEPSPSNSEPAPTEVEPYFDQVPYEELGDFSYESDLPTDDFASAPAQSAVTTRTPAPSAASAPGATPGPVSGAVSDVATTPTSSAAASAHTAPSVAAFGEKRPDPEPKEQSQDKADSSDEAPRPQAPEDLPPDLVNILEDAFEVFGSDVRVSKES